MALLNKTTLSIASGGGDTFTTLPALVEVPDLGIEPEGVQTTTLDDDNHTEEDGIGELGRLTFLFRYRAGDDQAYAIIQEHIGKEDIKLKVEYASGVEITFPSSGISTKMLGGSVNDVQNFELNTGVAGTFEVKIPPVTRAKATGGK